MKHAIGLIETRSLIAAIEAADVMAKAASVQIIDFEFVGSGLVAVTVQGDVGAVKAAVQSGVKQAALIGDVISSNVIARPHDEVDKIY